ncbi:hypothetical protein E3U36_10095 [Arsenophonus endosymbiont of Aphis craccivora]|nr:hypothetical protein E3U36_10095 [Arsenophonus endosymbiont of Aphis craccivora]
MPWGPDVETNLAISSANHLKVRFIQQSHIDADLILIGSHSPNSTSYLLGSTAASIVRHAKMTVLVAR